VARHWALFYISPATSTSFVGIADLELRGSPGGADLTTGLPVTAYSATTEFSPGPTSTNFAAQHAFDASLTTYWASTSGSTTNQRLAVDFVTDVPTIAEVKIRSVNTTYSPSDFRIEFSDGDGDITDDSQWTTLWSVSGEPAWTGGEERTFTDPAALTDPTSINHDATSLSVLAQFEIPGVEHDATSLSTLYTVNPPVEHDAVFLSVLLTGPLGSGGPGGGGTQTETNFIQPQIRHSILLDSEADDAKLLSIIPRPPNYPL